MWSSTGSKEYRTAPDDRRPAQRFRWSKMTSRARYYGVILWMGRQEKHIPEVSRSRRPRRLDGCSRRAIYIGARAMCLLIDYSRAGFVVMEMEVG